MIRVWSDEQRAGRLARASGRGCAFVYNQGADASRAVSMTMPLQLQSWNQEVGLHPIFAMNLPEGYLREKLRLAFAKAVGVFDDVELLSVTGRSQIGRLCYTDEAAETLSEVVPFQAVDEVLRHRRDGDLFDYMIERFAVYSGISGVQPKVMVRDEAASRVLSPNSGARRSSTFRGATHIVKFWEEGEYPQLAANEFFCLRVAEKAGLHVPTFQLADNAKALVVERFDLRPDGSYLGIEDFCVLNGRGADEKYKGGYETALVRRAAEFLAPEDRPREMNRLFRLFALNCAVRNGDAHLKNYALIYDDVMGKANLAPVYDVVTTTAYLSKDGMALTLEGSTKWPTARRLKDFGASRCGVGSYQMTDAFEEIATAMVEVGEEMRVYARDNPEFRLIGERMATAWGEGIRSTLGADEKVVVAMKRGTGSGPQDTAIAAIAAVGEAVADLQRIPAYGRFQNVMIETGKPDNGGHLSDVVQGMAVGGRYAALEDRRKADIAKLPTFAQAVARVATAIEDARGAWLDAAISAGNADSLWNHLEVALSAMAEEARGVPMGRGKSAWDILAEMREEVSHALGAEIDLVENAPTLRR